MQLLTVKESCARLRISRATLYNLVKKGKLAFVKIGGKSLIRDDAIDRLIAQETSSPGRRVRGVASQGWTRAWDDLVRRGLVALASRQAFLAPKYSDLSPIKTKGKAASEIILQERGER